MSRIPPRVAVRKNAPIELPHVMLLADDPDKALIEPLAGQTGEMELLYDFDLMERGGHVRGWKLTPGQTEHVARTLQAMKVRADEERGGLLLAVGDGNHSLATAKECYERRKRLANPDQWPNLPSRYALAELGNLHDEGLKFEPIHRLLTNLEPRQLLDSLLAAYPGAFEGEGEGHVLRYLHGYTEGAVTIPQPRCQLPVGTLQGFLDRWLEEHRDASIDYIHGENVARQLAARPRALAFFLDPMEKEHLFPTVIQDGKLPRKTFSMGEAQDKRFYLEARKIRV